ncbi:MAG TPA: hypothetical protein VNO50_03665 [Pyrinomonadaceae bacterium]|nr:hypothetical protein [Pyrinomonadaceae bacterium]
MKIRYFFLPGLLFANIASAQTASTPVLTDPPGVVVAEVRWQQEVFIPALYDDPMRINQDHRDLERDKKNTSIENSVRARQGQTPIPSPSKKIASNIPVGSTPMGVPLGDEPAGNRNLPARPEPGAASTYYLYKAKIRNNGTKAIRGVIWHFVLVDSGTATEVGRHRFIGKVSIKAGKSAELVARSRVPPTRIVRAGKSSGEQPGKNTERVIIERIEYDDGTFWQYPSQ